MNPLKGHLWTGYIFFFGMTATNNSISHHKRYFIIRATFIAAILCVFSVFHTL